MRKHLLIDELRDAGQEIIDQLEKLDTSTEKIWHLAEREQHARLQALTNTVQRDVRQLRHLYQEVILKLAILVEIEGNPKYRE